MPPTCQLSFPENQV